MIEDEKIRFSQVLRRLFGMSPEGSKEEGKIEEKVEETPEQKQKVYPVHRLLPYRVVTIDLGANALDQKEYLIGGDTIKINLTDGASAYLQLDSKDSDLIDLSLHTRIEIPSLDPLHLDHFEKFYITADKQADKVLVLTIGQRGRFKIY